MNAHNPTFNASAAPERTVKGPDPVDLHIGGRIRLRRKFLGMSQEALADAIDLTFQQVQKYERGSNRVSGSKLFYIAKALNTTVGYFYDGYGETLTESTPVEAEATVHAFLMTSEGVELAQSFPRIADAKTRRRILELSATLAGEE